MAQLITCPECKKQLQVPDDLVGQTVQCPECTHMFTVAVPVAERPSRAREEIPGEPISKRSKPRYDDDDDEDPVRTPPSINRAVREKPGKVTGLGTMALIGGIFAVLLAVSLGASLGAASCGLFCLWPGTYYSLIIGILAIIKGAALLGSEAYTQPPPTGIAIMLIINIINADIVGLTLGIIMLVFSGDQEVKDYLAK